MTSFDNKEIWIFLSHSSADFDKVRLIRNYLEEKSFRPLMFYLKCLDSDEETYNLITREIDVRTRFILCDSENARASEWVKREMDYIIYTFAELVRTRHRGRKLRQRRCRTQNIVRETIVFAMWSRWLSRYGGWNAKNEIAAVRI